MQADQPSRTAVRVALRRAAHQRFDAEPLIFRDPYAVAILGPWARELDRTPTAERSTVRDRFVSRGLRAWMVGRQRFAEDALAAAVAAGVRQYVLLGAGLDTFALRNPWPTLAVWEVDHPATQRAKEGLLAAAGLQALVSYIAADFEHSSLLDMLAEGDVDLDRPVFFAMLGVAPYLTAKAFRATVDDIGSLPAGTGLVLDYAQPRSALPPAERLAHDSLAARVRSAGEPFQLFWTPGEMARELALFQELDDLGSHEMNVRYFEPGGKPRADGLRLVGHAPRVVCATKR